MNRWPTMLSFRAHISRAIGSVGLPRELTLRVIATLHYELGHHAHRYSGLRIPGDEDRLFAFRVVFADDKQWHVFTFIVDDATASGRLVVEEVRYRSRPIPP